MGTNGIEVKVQDSVALIIITNPPSNYLGISFLKELESELERLQADSGVKSVVITGEGNVFTAGMNLKEICGVESYEQLTELIRLGHRVFNQIESLNKPVIAAVNGLCLGGGTEMILACHMRIASTEATIALPEIKVGILPGFGGTQRLPRLINLGKANEMILTGAKVGAEEAERIGLVNRVVSGDQLVEETMKLARKLAEKSRFALKAGLKSVYGGRDLSLDEGLKLEVEQVGGLWNQSDMKEGLNAFFEKRQPNYD